MTSVKILNEMVQELAGYVKDGVIESDSSEAWSLLNPTAFRECAYLAKAIYYYCKAQYIEEIKL
uniref:Uncharacterized protein n=1 Tax=viral metagenome TaxID=1070528 RepID=A0A6M3LLY8_9ZZZZ